MVIQISLIMVEPFIGSVISSLLLMELLMVMIYYLTSMNWVVKLPSIAVSHEFFQRRHFYKLIPKLPIMVINKYFSMSLLTSHSNCPPLAYLINQFT